MTGNAGSGKSTLSRQLAAGLDLPWFGLDQIVWQERWRKTPEVERDSRIADLIAQESWVVDGVSDQVLRAADAVVFLDVPRYRCYGRAARRNVRYLFSSRPELPDHCPEILIIPRLVKIIWRFPRHVRPRILAGRAEYGQDRTFIHVRSQIEPGQILARLR
ncbi:topology modulation protein [Longispora fulva]|uniref:Adenylate kinase family enzyme n=1 Tax=Longispora fulva TaxID=619741 RepID=A0A8J7KFI8_9ACTN|nr:hypothetical protein [Longispora fulva]MBG6136245.1 adenylate kinase family enzyme [Longispora fulva]GIG63427.1 topology modulation protein [Longispora fulva]